MILGMAQIRPRYCPPPCVVLGMGPFKRCKHCNQMAFAYRLEPDGSKIYYCARHIPARPVEEMVKPPPRPREPRAEKP